MRHRRIEAVIGVKPVALLSMSASGAAKSAALRRILSAAKWRLISGGVAEGGEENAL